MHDIALAVAQHLDLHVPAAGHEPLQIDPRVAEGRTGLGRGQLHGRGQVLQPIDPLHAAPAAPAHRLDQQGRADVAGQRHGVVEGVHRTAWGGRHARGLSLRPRAELVAHRFDLGRGGADEDHAFRLAELREGRAFRQEAVAGMDGVGA